MGWLDDLTKSGLKSDTVGNLLSSVGITSDVRAAAQPIIDNVGANLLPKGGAIPDNQQGVASSSWTSTMPSFAQQLFEPKIAGIPVLAIGIGALIVVLVMKGRK